MYDYFPGEEKETKQYDIAWVIGYCMYYDRHMKVLVV